LNQKEEYIIEGIRSGSETAYQQVFDLYYRNLVVFAMKYVADPEVAKDLVQDLFLGMYESRREIRIQVSLRSYLYSAVRNKCLNHLKQKSVREKHAALTKASETEGNTELEEKIHATELESRIFELVSQLPDKCRQIFIMSRVAGKRNSEIADELNLSKRTVETQISNALKSLRNSLFGFGI
jgi:RNA polymerase sigma-70 factor (ECF subfamily)